VLYAALARAAGLPAVLIVAPDHVLVGVPTGMPEQSGHLLSLDSERFLLHGGELFVPIELSALERSFIDAWKAGAIELAKWKKGVKSLIVVDPAVAWTRHAPALGAAPDVKVTWHAARGLREGLLKELLLLAEDRTREVSESTSGRGMKPDDRARMLALAGRYKEAQKLLEAIVGKDPSAHALNNLANVELSLGRTKDAIARYEQAHARARKPQRARITANHALALKSAGDERGFDTKMMDCIEEGGEDLVRAIQQSGYMDNGANRGSPTPDNRRPLTALLHWLSPAK
jgi:tetratricopeptide (TPR) repeat protein